jgi:DNA-binding IclR family transcriptional regulator
MQSAAKGSDMKRESGADKASGQSATRSKTRSKKVAAKAVADGGVIAKKKTPEKHVPAARRAIAILRLLAKVETSRTLREISSELELVPSTCLHILRVLVDESMVTFDGPTKRYQIGLGVLSLARAALNRDTNVEFLRREMELLSNRFRVTAVVTRVEQGHAITIATSSPPGVFSINIEVGSRYPAAMGATGRCLAAFGADKELVLSEIAKGKWVSMPTRAQWLREVESCRRLGYATDLGNLNSGVTVVAAPVFATDGRVTHTLGLISISELANAVGIQTMGKALVQVATRAHAQSRE